MSESDYAGRNATIRIYTRVACSNTLSTALSSKSVASAASKANYDLMYSSRDPRRSSADTRKRYHKAMRRAVRRFIIESMPKRN